MVWNKEEKQGNEAGKVRWELVPYTRGLVYDIGCGPSKAFPHFVGIDNNQDAILFEIQATSADLKVPDATKLPQLASSSADAIFSSHMLEHVVDYKAALREWWRIIKPGGHLCLYLPHKDLYPNIETKEGNPDHKHDFLPADIEAAMAEIGGWNLLVNETRDQGDEYSFLQVYKKYADRSLHRRACDEPKPAKTCAIVRYGAWGDVIQMSSILPALKEEGYHVTLYTVPRAWEAVKHEPLIDAVVLQDPEQVPNAWLGPYFKHLATKYEKFVNLCESVEGSLLAMPERAEFGWNHATRHLMLNRNYIELAHSIAAVKFHKPLMRFVATDEEKKWALAEKARQGATPLIMWVLAGSSIHKIWHGIDPVLARVMLTIPQAKVITVGDERCKKMIEAPWEKEPRIVRRSGDWTIRQTMAMAQVCDLVIGPETGVMSAVAMEPMPKIVLLSHSSEENLTKGWANTYSIHSADTPCYPCHRMVYDWSQCVRDEETGTAKCQADIHPDQVWDALLRALGVVEEQQEAA